MLNGHGDNAYQFKEKIIADFSTNVWYGGEPGGLKEYLFEKWHHINRYPEVIGESLTARIASHHELADNQILVNSGTTESIYLLAQLFAGRKTTIVVPSFPEYEDACMMHGHEITYLPWSEMNFLPRINAQLVFICNPNNPTGETFQDLDKWITKNPHCTFVVDEAFIDFTENIVSLIPLINRHSNLIIMRSLTKTYAIPGLRLGYVAGDNDWIAQLRNIKQPWTVNTMALLAGDFIFNNFARIQLPLKQLLADKTAFASQLAQNESLRIHQSHSHFFLAETLVRNAAQLKNFLIESHGLLIRDAGNFRGLSRQHFRVATLDSQKNQLLINALEEWKNLYF